MLNDQVMMVLFLYSIGADLSFSFITVFGVKVGVSIRDVLCLHIL